MSERFYTVLSSPIGQLLVTGTAQAITGLCLENRLQRSSEYTDALRQEHLPLFQQTSSWLQSYFNGENPSPDELPIYLTGTPFQMAIWAMLRRIPYGETATYGSIARAYAAGHGTPPCPRAVGGAVSRNPVWLLIPCHRVIGAGGVIGGYAGGIHAKQLLLALENPCKKILKPRP